MPFNIWIGTSKLEQGNFPFSYLFIFSAFACSKGRICNCNPSYLGQDKMRIKMEEWILCLIRLKTLTCDWLVSVMWRLYWLILSDFQNRMLRSYFATHVSNSDFPTHPHHRYLCQHGDHILASRVSRISHSLPQPRPGVRGPVTHGRWRPQTEGPLCSEKTAVPRGAA